MDQKPLRPGQNNLQNGNLISASKMFFSKSFIPFWAALCLSFTLYLYDQNVSTPAKFSNANLTKPGFSQQYIMINKTRPDRCFLTKRRDATIRRSRKNFKGNVWDIKRVGNPSSLNQLKIFLLGSKTKGTLFFIPVEAVNDLIYPFLYGYIKKELQFVELPDVEWVQLYVDRYYTGLYLRMVLPFDPIKKEGRIGPRRELIAIRGNTFSIVNTRFNPDTRLFVDLIANGDSPKIQMPHPALLWLSDQHPNHEQIFLLSNNSPYHMKLLPLPFSISSLYKAIYNEDPKEYYDERIISNAMDIMSTKTLYNPLTSSQKTDFETEYNNYIATLKLAIDSQQSIFLTSKSLLKEDLTKPNLK